jgi:hypothetical protein
MSKTAKQEKRRAAKKNELKTISDRNLEAVIGGESMGNGQHIPGTTAYRQIIW